MSYNLESNRKRQARWYKAHAEEKNKLTKDRYWGLRRAGLCPCCGGPRDRKPLILCKACADKRN